MFVSFISAVKELIFCLGSGWGSWSGVFQAVLGAGPGQQGLSEKRWWLFWLYDYFLGFVAFNFSCRLMVFPPPAQQPPGSGSTPPRAAWVAEEGVAQPVDVFGVWWYLVRFSNSSILVEPRADLAMLGGGGSSQAFSG